jgi:hypothetical protein
MKTVRSHSATVRFCQTIAVPHLRPCAAALVSALRQASQEMADSKADVKSSPVKAAAAKANGSTVLSAAALEADGKARMPAAGSLVIPASTTTIAAKALAESLAAPAFVPNSSTEPPALS